MNNKQTKKITVEVNGEVSLEELHKQSMKVFRWVNNRMKVNTHVRITFNRSMAMAVVKVDKKHDLVWKAVRDE